MLPSLLKKAQRILKEESISCFKGFFAPYNTIQSSLQTSAAFFQGNTMFVKQQVHFEESPSLSWNTFNWHKMYFNKHFHSKGAAFLEQKQRSFSISSMSSKKVTFQKKHVPFQTDSQYSTCWKTVHVSCVKQTLHSKCAWLLSKNWVHTF